MDQNLTKMENKIKVNKLNKPNMEEQFLSAASVIIQNHNHRGLHSPPTSHKIFNKKFNLSSNLKAALSLHHLHTKIFILYWHCLLLGSILNSEIIQKITKIHILIFICQTFFLTFFNIRRI